MAINNSYMGLGERCKLPQRGLDWSPAESNLMHLSLKIRHLVAPILLWVGAKSSAYES